MVEYVVNYWLFRLLTLRIDIAILVFGVGLQLFLFLANLRLSFLRK